MATRAKIYQLYGRPGWGLSSKGSDYRELITDVLAFTSKQAHFFGGTEVWATGPENPLGIVQFYDKHDGGGWHTLWDGCRSRSGLPIEHQSSKTATVKAMLSHIALRHSGG